MKNSMQRRLCGLALTVYLALVSALPLAGQDWPADFRVKGTVLVKYLGSAASVEIPQGITEIGEGAFYAMPIRTVSLPAELTAIGDHAFAGTQLSTVDLPAGLTAIGDSAFAYTRLSAVDLPAGLISIRDRAFAYTQLSEVDLPAGLISIGDRAFAYCENLRTVKLSRKTKVPDKAFYDSPVQLHYRD